MIAEIDNSGDGNIDFNEFLQVRQAAAAGLGGVLWARGGTRGRSRQRIKRRAEDGKEGARGQTQWRRVSARGGGRSSMEWQAGLGSADGPLRRRCAVATSPPPLPHHHVAPPPQVMAKPQDLPYKKADVMRAFRLFADRDAPQGCISPEALERALVGAGASARRAGRRPHKSVRGQMHAHRRLEHTHGHGARVCVRTPQPQGTGDATPPAPSAHTGPVLQREGA